jgi:hypothetical protein
LDAAGEQLSCVNSCKIFAMQKWTANSPVSNQLLSIQLTSSDASSKIPKPIVMNSETDCDKGARKLGDEPTKE